MHPEDDIPTEQLDERGLPCSSDYWETYAGPVLEQILEEISGEA